MLRLLLLGCALFLGFSSEASSQEYCQEENLVLDQELLWDFRGFATQLALPTRRQGELMESFGRANFGSGGDSKLWIQFENGGTDPYGLEYVVYKIELVIGDPLAGDFQQFSQDFSRDCSEPGFGVSYGSRRRLAPVEIKPLVGGAPRGIERVRLRVWGRQ